MKTSVLLLCVVAFACVLTVEGRWCHCRWCKWWHWHCCRCHWLATPQEVCVQSMVIQSQDTCDGIAKRFDVPGGLEGLQLLNPTLECAAEAMVKSEGNLLCLKLGSADKPQVKCALNAMMKAGDTCADLSLKYKIPDLVAQMDKLNRPQICDKLIPGEIMCLKEGKEIHCGEYHVVLEADKACESLGGEQLLSSLNPDLDCKNIQIGQVLCVRQPPTDTSFVENPLDAIGFSVARYGTCHIGIDGEVKFIDIPSERACYRFCHSKKWCLSFVWGNGKCYAKPYVCENLVQSTDGYKIYTREVIPGA